MDTQEERDGMATLSLPGRIAVAAGVVVVAVAVAVHLAMVFLHVAPENTLSKRYGTAVDDYVYPEFEQNWKLFAPNPLQQNIAVHARARVRLPDGTTDVTGWVDLSAQDGERIHGNPFPSHVSQNELRRAWDFYTGSHDEKDKPDGLRGALSQQYVKRIVTGRFGTHADGGHVVAVQVRSATTPVAAPPWSSTSYDASTQYRVLPWWPVTDADVPGSSR